MQSLKDYRLSPVTGALLETPLITLPAGYDRWNTLIQDLPNLFKRGKLREEVQKLPLLLDDGLTTHEELRLAHKTLAFVASVYVWQNGEGGEPEYLPAQIAVPLLKISERLGLQPITTHEDLVLCNCIPTTDESPPEIIHYPTSHENWKPFIELGGYVEIAFAPALQPILDALKAQDPLDEQKITQSLLQVIPVLLRMQHGFGLFHGRLDPTEFYVELRTFLCGWTRGSLKNGLIYEEADASSTNEVSHKIVHNRDANSFCPKGKKFGCIGPSAAQSICLQVIDAFLGVVHHASDRQFFETMRTYMIAEHRKFLQDIEKYSRIRAIVGSTKCRELKDAYERCLAGMRDVREDHMKLVQEFITEPAAAQVAKVKSLKIAGTGGQSLASFLTRVKDHTV
ncbi:unnamed protein product [Calicophoron daubneyi]|uniref:Indoleamine 2,3-dioxygenase n=1 Tax=Calicophoron daubneyi TaxID=300641 RepID=A0AAV2TH80_CALDB